MVKTLAGQEVEEKDYAALFAAVDKLLWEIVYAPIVKLVRPTLPAPVRPELATTEMRESTARELHNAGEAALRKALQDGRVQMVKEKDGGVRFTVAKPDRRVSDGLRAIGAKLERRTGDWTISPEAVPTWVRLEADGYRTKMRAAHEAVKKMIDDLAGKVDALVDRANLAAAAGDAVNQVQKGGWKEGAKTLEASWNLGPAGQTALARAFERTRQIPIKSPGSKVDVVGALDASTKREVKVWAAEALARLRAEVELNAEQGYRSAGLAERIRNEYGVSKTRADLIARQETSNFMANYREARAADAGLKRYQWVCVRDSRTRKDHLALHGKIFFYSRPPVTDQRTGARNNPGQDFRCRCTDRPVIE